MFKLQMVGALCVLAVAALHPTAAFADRTGGSPLAHPQSAQELKRTSDKEVMARNIPVWPGSCRTPQETGPGVSSTCYPASSLLAITGYIAQPDGDTCGPTSVRNALVTWGKNVTVSAMKPQIGFDADQTPWSDMIPQALNHNINQAYYIRSESPTQDSVWLAFQYSTGQEQKPVILNVVMLNGMPRLAGYNPNTEYYHFNTGIGYDGTAAVDNATIWYFDQYDRPSTQWGNPYGKQSTTLKTITTLLSTHGMVW